MFGAEAKAPFAKREARHHDSHRCREGGQHGGMSGQQGHGVGVGTWPAGPEGARPKNSITSNKNKASATSAMTKETVGVLHNKKITTGSTIAAIRSGRLPARTQRPAAVEATPVSPWAQPSAEPNHPRTATATRDGPLRNAPAAKSKATPAITRSPTRR